MKKGAPHGAPFLFPVIPDLIRDLMQKEDGLLAILPELKVG